MQNSRIDNFRISQDFRYEKNIALGDHLQTKMGKFTWHASALDSLELELFVPPEEAFRFFEAFAVHTTDELPFMLNTFNIFEFSGGKHLEILITPNVLTSDKSLKALEPTDRSCYFENERKLRFFKVYTKENCEIECFSNHSLETCNCVPFASVQEPKTRVCGISDEDIDCSYNFRKNFSDYEPTGMLASCSCLSPCDSVSYDIKVSESKLRENE